MVGQQWETELLTDTAHARTLGSVSPRRCATFIKYPKIPASVSSTSGRPKAKTKHKREHTLYGVFGESVPDKQQVAEICRIPVKSEDVLVQPFVTMRHECNCRFVKHMLVLLFGYVMVLVISKP